MSNFTVEYKKKNESGFIHQKVTTSDQDRITELYNECIKDGVVGLEFFNVRAVRQKSEPKPKEIKK